MTEIKKEILDIDKFNNLQKMFESSLDEDFFLALNLWGKHSLSQTINTLMARRISRNESRNTTHSRMRHFVGKHTTFCLDDSLHMLIPKMNKDKLCTQLIREELLYTMNQVLKFHNLDQVMKNFTLTQIKLHE